MNRLSVEGKVALVTGAGSGIGRGIAYALADHGADVVVAGRRVEPLERTAGEITARGRQALVVSSDVTDPDQCDQLVASTVERFGRLDVLVNNAGGSPMKPVEQWTPKEWHDLIDLNLSTVWFLSRAAATPMLEQGSGSIINIASGAGIRPVATMAPYGAAKAGVINLTASLAVAWTPRGVRVNAVAAGIVRTELLMEESQRLGLDPESFGATNAMKRLGEPAEIADAVLYFATDASSYCSGQTLQVNGGPLG